MDVKTKLKLGTILGAILFLFGGYIFATIDSGRYIDYGAMIMITSPIIAFFVYKWLVSMLGTWGNRNIKRGLIRLLLFCIFMAMQIVGIISMVAKGDIRFSGAVIFIFIIFGAECKFLWPFVIKDFEKGPLKGTQKQTAKVCDNCGWILDELDNSQIFESKTLCEKCFKQLKLQKITK